jgi:hypothetical protein
MVLARHHWPRLVILATQQAEMDQEDHGSSLAQEKCLIEPHLDRKTLAWWYMPFIPETAGNINSIMVLDGSSKTGNPISK